MDGYLKRDQLLDILSEMQTAYKAATSINSVGTIQSWFHNNF